MSAFTNPGMAADFAGGSDDLVRRLNSLLRGEISAAETYTMAIQNLGTDAPPASRGLLRDLQSEHGRAAQMIRTRIRNLGGEASDSSGAWGAWAKTVQGTMNLFGDAASLKALKEGEEHGLKEYEQAVDAVDPDTSQMISSTFVPVQQKHVSIIDQLIESAQADGS